jgi:hypothetical protein
MEFLQKLLASDFMGHGYCYLWRPEIVWLHVISHTLISLAYYSIPITLLYAVVDGPLSRRVIACETLLQREGPRLPASTLLVPELYQ